jgi:hypothetical protein
LAPGGVQGAKTSTTLPHPSRRVLMAFLTFRRWVRSVMRPPNPSVRVRDGASRHRLLSRRASPLPLCIGGSGPFNTVVDVAQNRKSRHRPCPRWHSPQRHSTTRQSSSRSTPASSLGVRVCGRNWWTERSGTAHSMQRARIRNGFSHSFRSSCDMRPVYDSLSRWRTRPVYE